MVEDVLGNVVKELGLKHSFSYYKDIYLIYENNVQ